MKITCDSELIGIEGRKLVFKVEAYDSKGLIGKGIHERFQCSSFNTPSRISWHVYFGFPNFLNYTKTIFSGKILVY